MIKEERPHVTRKDINKYLEMKISGMSQKELIVFLYESAVNLMEEARITINDGDVPGTHQRLDRARNIFLHLLSTLNLEAGGDFAKRLSGLYSYFIEKITMANGTRNVQELDDIIPVVNDIKNAWQDLKADTIEQNPSPAGSSGKRQLVSMEV
jgi:flagellar protein FliS